MIKHAVSYHKYNIDVLTFKDKYYLNEIFSYYDNSHLVTKAVYEKNLIKDFRLICGLQDKNSELYSELILAINKFNKGIYKHIVPNTVSSKILNKTNIRIYNSIKIKLFPDDAVRYLSSKNEYLLSVFISNSLFTYHHR